jgi:ABC-type transporter Mla subunit MlaD
MKNITSLAMMLALSASAAFASDHLNQIANHARELATDYRKMTVTLKDKNFAAHELRQELKDADEALAQVKELVGQYEATQPNLNAAQQKEWKKLQDLVALLAIFQDRKNELLSDSNPQKQRKSAQAEAQALVTRATMLEQTARRLAGEGMPQS